MPSWRSLSRRLLAKRPAGSAPDGAALHPRYHTPHRLTLLCGATVALVAALTPIDKLAYLCNIGTLFAFFLVCLGVLVLRLTQPDRPRPFRCPWGKTVAALGALVCLALMLSLPAASWWRLGLWLLSGLAVYCLYAGGPAALGR